jgi:hypothetical protein
LVFESVGAVEVCQELIPSVYFGREEAVDGVNKTALAYIIYYSRLNVFVRKMFERLGEFEPSAVMLI